MPITYVTGSDGVGRPLTAAEVDANFSTLETGLQGLLDTPPGVSIDTITVSGRYMTVELSDGSTRGPFALPYAIWRYRGAWVGFEGYFEMDVVLVAGQGLFLVLEDHVAADTFDAAAAISSGALYLLIAPGPVTATVLVEGTSFTPDETSANRMHNCTTSIGCAITLPTYLYPLDTILQFRQSGDGALTFTIDVDGDYIDGIEGYDNATARRGSVVEAKYVADGIWWLYGTLAAVSA